MKKYIQVICLILACLCAATSASAVQIIGLGNFVKNQEYTEDVFSDVPKNEWYYDSVAASYEYGLLNGVGNNTFAPNADISLAETTTIAVRINNMYYEGLIIEPGHYEEQRWYDPYVHFAQSVGILTTDYPDYDAPATRAQFAAILAASVDSAEFTENEINWIDDGAIPDVPMDAEYTEAVYMLYRAGILTGSDGAGSFNPEGSITRAEAAAIITQIVDPGLRKNFDLYGEY